MSYNGRSLPDTVDVDVVSNAAEPGVGGYTGARASRCASGICPMLTGEHTDATANMAASAGCLTVAGLTAASDSRWGRWLAPHPPRRH